jgi:hypothetical protein
MKEIWMTHLSVKSWNVASKWDEYLRNVESVLADKIAKLDTYDPVRRKADTARGEGEFITNFGPKEDSRWLSGKLEKTGIEFEIQIYKNGADSGGRSKNNSIRFSFPQELTFGPSVKGIVELFRLNNGHLDAFYAFADFKEVISSKKPGTPSLDISRELLGVFWLTYFGAHYCDFFGREKLAALDQASQGSGNGITLRLAETAGQVANGDRQKLEELIGSLSFVGTSGTNPNNPFAPKQAGKHALTMAQLSS